MPGEIVPVTGALLKDKTIAVVKVNRREID